MTSMNMTKIVECIPQNGLDFEYCAVKQVYTKKFTINNPLNSMVQFEVLLDTSDNACFDIEPRNGKLHLAFLNVCSDANYVFFFSYAQSRLQERSYRYF
jgi:hypothetical protein